MIKWDYHASFLPLTLHFHRSLMGSRPELDWTSMGPRTDDERTMVGPRLVIDSMPVGYIVPGGDSMPVGYSIPMLLRDIVPGAYFR